MSQSLNNFKLFSWTWQWAHCTKMAHSHQISTQ